MAELVILNPTGRSRTHQLGTEPVTMGRDPNCDIPLDDLSTSRRHARIRFENGTYYLEDLGSKNGLVVNNVDTRSAVLQSGDEILIGAVRALFREDANKDVYSSVIIAEEPTEHEATTFIGDSKALVLSQRRLEILYDLTDRLTRLRDRDDLLEDAMDVCCEMLRFERAAIAVKQPKGNLVDWPVVRNLRGQEGELTVSRTILSLALVQDERVIVNESDQSILDPTVSMVRNNIRSAMCVPLLSGDRNLGVIYGDRVTTGTTYAQDDIDFLAGIARLVTTGLINAQLMEEQKLKLQLENEMGMARQIQTGLFPAKLPDRDEVKVAALNHPGFHVSGDYYDVVELDDGRVFFLIADVTGEGVAASLLMANLQAAVRITLPHCTSTGELLTQWNDLICANTDASRFITAIVGILNPATRALDLGVAGHHMPHIVRPNAPCTNLSAEPEYPLGVIEDVKFESTQIVLDPGPCTLVTYTDGIIEAMNDEAEQYGTERTMAFLETVADLPPQKMVDKLRQDVKRFSENQPQGDDITILAIHLP
ncbi:MAG: SpoIIE family protein phosphatase [Planctomycetes bacterium]|nr:SpoIIE family protein phosphatase [Planctomycetota bacterium]